MHTLDAPAYKVHDKFLRKRGFKVRLKLCKKVPSVGLIKFPNTIADEVCRSRKHDFIDFGMNVKVSLQILKYWS